MTKKKLLKALAVAAITTSLVACSNGSSDDSSSTASTSSGSTVATTTKTIDTSSDNVKANASYTIGYGMGSSISQDPNLKSYDLLKDQVIAGFKDAMGSKKPEISEQDIKNNMGSLRQTMMKKMSEQRVTSFLKVKNSMYNSDLTLKSDVKNPDVVIYEFFDYQCMYCSKLAPGIEEIMKHNSNVQIIFGEFPIFGQRAPASEYAAEVGTAIYKLYGADTYVKYHNGVFATGEDEGKLTDATVNKVATQAGAKIDAVKKAITNDKIAAHVKSTLEMGFKDLDIQGTPFLVVAPLKGANADNTTIIDGYTSTANIQKAINKAKPSNKISSTTTSDKSK
ncbi:lipoprotein [Francisella halioticida]|uniref:DsbA-like infectivity potentiator lipoprotein FipB n=1 Tax=Francisella halioticida TaxID=549298 RepID=UPI001AFB58C8|nr:thioredoxin domain-containing protein [Francisella halioticida]BCD90786.1 lipoprotein [Francisella halioticida]